MTLRQGSYAEYFLCRRDKRKPPAEITAERPA
jgi:hypothetical protein